MGNQMDNEALALIATAHSHVHIACGILEDDQISERAIRQLRSISEQLHWWIMEHRPREGKT